MITVEADLHREVLLRLRCLDLLAATAPAAMSLAGISMGALAVSWRALLLEHHPADREGLCPACYPWRGPRPVWPCRIWHRAHRALGRYMITAVALSLIHI